MKTKVKKQRRAGATETFSVSVDPETKRALRAMADQDFGGNMSALITDFAANARRRLAAAAYLRRHRYPPLSPGAVDALQVELEREIAAAKKKPRRRKAA